MYDRPACLPGSVRVPDTQHLLPGGEGNIPWEWTGAGEQTIRCERKDCCGRWVRTIEPATLSADTPYYTNGSSLRMAEPPPCPDRAIPEIPF